jgi:acetyl esterase/lipase
MELKTVIQALLVLISLSDSVQSATNDISSAETSSPQSNKPKKGTAAYLETGGERKLEIRYKKTLDGDLHLDLYYPTRKPLEKCPVIIYTHGGGWAAGSKMAAGNALFAATFKQLVNQGFAVASVEYRLCKKESPVSMRDCVIDSKDAIRYLSRDSESLGIDPLRVYAMGDSAGGQIAQMLLLSSPESLPGDPGLAGAPYKMVAGVSWYGPCDFEKEDLFNPDDRANFRDRFGSRILKPGSKPEEKLPLYREMSPINYLTKDSPPLLMVQGDKDTTIPVKHAYYMQKKAAALKAPVEIMIIQHAGHNWRKVDADIEPSREVIVARTVQFYVDHLKSR